MISEATLDKLQNGGRIAEEEWHEILDWLCRYQFRQNHNVNFWYVNHFLCEDALKILSRTPGRWKTLAKVYDSMSPASRFPFLLHCFRMRGCLSTDELAGLWYRCGAAICSGTPCTTGSLPASTRNARSRPSFLETGCDPNNRNQLGLAWQDANDWLTLPITARIGLLKGLIDAYDTSEHKEFIGESIAGLFREILCACWEV